jgi:Uma2 family endonuclease
MLVGMDEMHTRENNRHEEEDEMTVLQDRPATVEADEPDSTELDKLFEYIETDLNPPPGFKVQIIEGAIVMSPQRDVHFQIILKFLMAFTAVLSERETERLFSDVRLDAPGWHNGLVPDVMLLNSDAQKLKNGCYRYQDARLVVEVVSRGSHRDDYGRKLQTYALAGVPIYVIVDPKAGQVHVYTEPYGASLENAGYREAMTSLIPS